jgi:hypothetical protein
VPWGFRKLLTWIKNEYNDPPVFVTENGVSDPTEFNYTLRIHYYTVGIFASIQVVQHCCSISNMAVQACAIVTMDARRRAYGYNQEKLNWRFSERLLLFSGMTAM